jgi:hypothetical protein
VIIRTLLSLVTVLASIGGIQVADLLKRLFDAITVRAYDTRLGGNMMDMFPPQAT